MPTLADKITSEADLKVAMNGYRVQQQTMNYRRDTYYMPWWLKREWARIEKKVYPEASSVIEQLNHMAPQFALHVSKEDPNFIAYTPDKASGEADRQLKTSLGKFIAKYYPHFKDEEVGQMVADHLGEVTGEIELIYGQDIINVYRGGTGATSCMTKSESMFNLDDHHPAEVYAMPNIAMAVVRNSAGAITARSMVYSPTPEDKRYIRVYGDEKLTKRLRKAGYVLGAWYGAEFKLITLTDGKTLMPYLDGDGSMGSSARSNVVLIDGKLRSIDSTQADGIRSACGMEAVRCCTGTSGWQQFIPITSDQFNKVCAVSGVIVNCLVDRLWPYFMSTDDLNTPLMVCKDVYDSGVDISIRKSRGDYARVYRVAASIPTFTHGGHNYPDTQTQREWAGFMKLDPTYYPDEQEWVSPGAYYQEPFAGYKQSGSYLLKEADAVVGIVANHSTVVHQQSIGKGWVKVHSMTKGVDVYADPLTTVVKTSTGRKVVPAVHAVHQTYTGTWEFKRNLDSTNLFSKRVWHLKGETLRYGTETTKPMLHDYLNRLIAKGDTVFEAVIKVVRGYLSDYITVNGRSLYQWKTAQLPTWDVLYPLILADSGSNAPYQLALAEQLNQFYTGWKAEAEALDYNGQHDVSMNTCEEPVIPVGVITSLPTNVGTWPTTTSTATGSIYGGAYTASTTTVTRAYA